MFNVDVNPATGDAYIYNMNTRARIETFERSAHQDMAFFSAQARCDVLNGAD